MDLLGKTIIMPPKIILNSEYLPCNLKGAISTEGQTYRPLVKVFLKRNKKSRRKLLLDHPKTFPF